jgi:hypothetical protein
MKLRFLVLALSLLLAGCVSAPMPVPAGYQGPLAKISDSSQPVSSTKIQFFQLAKVDGRPVDTSSASTYRANQGRGFYMEPQLEAREVPARTCVLSLQGVTHVAADILAFGGGMYHVEGDVTVTLDPARTYVIKGTLAKDYSAVWLEDADGHIVSTLVEKGKKP